MPLGNAVAFGRYPGHLYYNWAAAIQLNASLWLHPVCEDLPVYTSGLWLVGCSLVRPPDRDISIRFQCIWALTKPLDCMMSSTVNIEPQFPQSQASTHCCQVTWEPMGISPWSQQSASVLRWEPQIWGWLQRNTQKIRLGWTGHAISVTVYRVFGGNGCAW